MGRGYGRDKITKKREFLLTNLRFFCLVKTSGFDGKRGGGEAERDVAEENIERWLIPASVEDDNKNEIN